MYIEEFCHLLLLLFNSKYPQLTHEWNACWYKILCLQSFDYSLLKFGHFCFSTRGVLLHTNHTVWPVLVFTKYELLLVMFAMSCIVSEMWVDIYRHLFTCINGPHLHVGWLTTCGCNTVSHILSCGTCLSKS